MKAFTNYLAELNKTYTFAIRVANCKSEGSISENIKSALSQYSVESVSSARRLPIQEHQEFPGLGACEVHIVEVNLKYPTIAPQISLLVAEKLRISGKQVVTRTALEESQREAAPVTSVKAKDGSVLSNPTLESTPSQEIVGNQRVDSMLKELQSRKFDYAAKPEAHKSVNMPINTASPVGSRQNTIPSPKGK